MLPAPYKVKSLIVEGFKTTFVITRPKCPTLVFLKRPFVLPRPQGLRSFVRQFFLLPPITLLPFPEITKGPQVLKLCPTGKKVSNNKWPVVRQITYQVGLCVNCVFVCLLTLLVLIF